MNLKRALVPLTLCGLILLAIPAVGQEPTDMEAMMATFQKLATPGEHHTHLSKMAGSWKTEAKFWMAPGAEPTLSTGTMEAEAILGGRFIRSVFKGDFQGNAFEGWGIDGYDNYAGEHVGIWIDNMGTYIQHFTGECSEGGKVTTATGEIMEPMSGQAMPQKTVITWTDDDHYTYEAYLQTPDGEMKTMEMTATRQ